MGVASVKFGYISIADDYSLTEQALLTSTATLTSLESIPLGYENGICWVKMKSSPPS